MASLLGAQEFCLVEPHMAACQSAVSIHISHRYCATYTTSLPYFLGGIRVQVYPTSNIQHMEIWEY